MIHIYGSENEKAPLPKIPGSYKKSVFLKINFADTTFYKNKQKITDTAFCKKKMLILHGSHGWSRDM